MTVENQVIYRNKDEKECDQELIRVNEDDKLYVNVVQRR